MKSYIIRIELQDSDPLIWRKVIMPADATFNRLHDIIQNVTNFGSGYPHEDYHLFEFDLKEENIKVTNDEEAYQEHKYYKEHPEEVEARLADMPSEYDEFKEKELEALKTEIRKPVSIKIDNYLEKYKKIKYIYDFGDYWQFMIKLVDTVDDYHFGFPTLLDGAQTSPPEDVGGIGGFYEFLKIYKDKGHEQHESMKAWAEEQNYKEFDLDHINMMLKYIKYKKTEWDKINHENYKIIEDKYRSK